MSLMLSLGLTSLIMSTAVACGEDSKSVSTDATVLQASYVKNADIVDTAVDAGKFNTLAAALKAAGLVDALKSDGPFTVFAPTDDAFAALPAGTVESLLKPENKERLTQILKYHVVPGRVLAVDVVKLDHATTLCGQRIDISTDGAVTVDGAKVVKTDIECSNGVIHVIDSVIVPEALTIPEIAASNGNFETLVTAVQAAGLLDTLNGPGPFTVFAPTDEAFAALPAGTLESLLKPENRAKLVSILTYHVVPGRVYADQVVKLDSAKTAQGSSVSIKSKNGVVRINGARVVATDIEASNGVVHVIDRVILPD